MVFVNAQSTIQIEDGGNLYIAVYSFHIAELFFMPVSVSNSKLPQEGVIISDGDIGCNSRPETGNHILVGSEDPECDEREYVNPDSSFSVIG